MNKLKVKELRIIAKQRGIKYYSKLKKAELVSTLKQRRSCIKIQRFLRQVFASSPMCLLSHRNFQYPCWCYIHKGKFYYYNLEELVQYVLYNGYNTKDVRTFIKYSKDDLDSINKAYTPFDIIRTIQQRNYEEERVRDQQIDILILLVRDTLFHTLYQIKDCKSKSVFPSQCAFIASMKSIREYIQILKYYSSEWSLKLLHMILDECSQISDVSLRLFCIQNIKYNF